MLKLGLTGSFGSGKSTVAAIFKQQGIPVIDADVIARHVLEQDLEVRAAVAQRFPTAHDRDGKLDRALLAAQVFPYPNELKALNELMQATIRRTLREAMHVAERAQAALLLVDVPLLFESGLDRDMDKTIVVTLPEHLAIERLAQRGFSPEQVHARLQHQMPLSEKINRADFIIDNSGSREATRQQCLDLIQTVSL